MVIKKNIVDELKSFYFQNVIACAFIAISIFSSIVLGVLPDKAIWLVAAATLVPFLYEMLSIRLREVSRQSYFLTGSVIYGILYSIYLYVVSYDPTLGAMVLVMYTYTLISYSGVKVWLALFPSMCAISFLIGVVFPHSFVFEPNKEIVIPAIVACCCFIVVSAAYRAESRELLLKSKKELTKEFEKNRILLKNISRYISPNLVEMLATEENPIEVHQRKEVVVFFSDLCSFTSMSEEMSPEDMSYILNEYLAEMSAIAHRHGATIDKFIGDAIMIFFGAPSSLGPKEDAIRCLRMAEEMRRKMSVLNESWRSKGITHSFRVRMGINQGWATVGNFGAENQVNYTVIGTAVNIAARLEQSCQPNGILVSKNIVERVSDVFDFTSVGKLELKGIDYPVEAYTLESSSEPESKPVRLIIEASHAEKTDVLLKLRRAGISAKEIKL